MTTTSHTLDRRAAPTSGRSDESEGHRARRLKLAAERAADEVVRSGRPVPLAAMSDQDREIVREHLRWRTDLVARSVGDGPGRHLVVIPI